MAKAGDCDEVRDVGGSCRHSRLRGLGPARPGLFSACPAFSGPVAARGTPEGGAQAQPRAWNQAHWTPSAEKRRGWEIQRQADLLEKPTSLALMRFDREGKTSGMPPQFS